MSPKFLRRASRAAVVAVVVAMGLTACSGGSTDSSNASGGNTIKWAVVIPPDWDPVLQAQHYPQYYLSLVYEPLVEIDKNGEPAPGLAESWDFSPDGKKLTLNLREGQKFTDGTLVNAEAVKAFFERALNDEASARKVDFESVESATVDSESKVTLNLKRPNYSILLRLGPKAGQVPSPAVDPAELKQHPVGAGPFTVTEFVEGDHVYLEKNPDYWDAENILVDRVEFYPAPTAGPQSVAAVTSGQYTITLANDPTTRAAAVGVEGIRDSPPGNDNNYYIDLNIGRAPFNDHEVVKAVNLAINREEFVAKANAGVGKPAYQPYQKGEIGHVEAFDHPEYNPDKAKQVLEAAGYEPGDITFTIPSTALYQSKAEVLQSQLNAIGIETDIKILQDAESSKLSATHSQEYALYLGGTHNFIDPLETFGQQYDSAGNVNISGIEPADFDKLLAEAESTPLDSPNYQAAVEALANASLNQHSKIYYATYNYSYLQTTKLSDLPSLPGQISVKGVDFAKGGAGAP